MKTIVVGVDRSEGSKAALTWGVEQARLCGDTRVVALSAWRPVIAPSDLWWAEYDIPYDLHAGTLATLKAAVAEVRRPELDVEIEERVVLGSPVDALINAARPSDVLVVGSRGFGGFNGLLLGSVSHQLVTHAPCPTVVVPLPGSREGGDNHDPRQILVGIDGSRTSVAALEWAGDWATRTGAQVRAVHACGGTPMIVSPDHMRAEHSSAHWLHDEPSDLASFVAATEPASDHSIQTHIRQGEPTRVLLEEAAHAGLVVVGTRGRGGFMGLLLGSVASALVNHCPCPVAVVPCARRHVTDGL
jgi:nucleotide-binding universal stress UspA family protein